MKTKIVLMLPFLLAIILAGVFFYPKYKHFKSHQEVARLFVENLRKRWTTDAEITWMSTNDFRKYDEESLKEKLVISIADSSKHLAKTLLNSKNQFRYFAANPEEEFPELQSFFEKYGDKIPFVVFSLADFNSTKNASKKTTFPIYCIKNHVGLLGTDFYPISHLLLNNRTAFIFSGKAYFDNDYYDGYVDSLLVN